MFHDSVNFSEQLEILDKSIKVNEFLDVTGLRHYNTGAFLDSFIYYMINKFNLEKYFIKHQPSQQLYKKINKCMTAKAALYHSQETYQLIIIKALFTIETLININDKIAAAAKKGFTNVKVEMTNQFEAELVAEILQSNTYGYKCNVIYKVLHICWE